jgi:F-type H+-transporting ATPase subunit epsilon
MFSLSIVTPEAIIYEGEAISLIAPGVDGYFEILAHHASMIAGLQPGKMTLTLPDGKKNVYAMNFGFLEVSQNKASVLADSIELATDINVNRAKSALKRASMLLNDEENKEIDVDRANEAYHRAQNRLKIAQEKEKH